VTLPSILSIDQLASAELHAKWQDDFSRPACVNDHGFFVVGRDPMGISDVMIPPFSMGAENTALLYINRKHPPSEGVEIGYTWYPDRVERRARFDGLDIFTITRAPVARSAALIDLTVTNPGAEPRDVEVAVKVAGRVLHTIDRWKEGRPWIDHLTGHPEAWEYDASLGAMSISSAPGAFSVQGSRPKPDAVENKALLYRTRLAPGARWRLCFVVALGDSAEAAAEQFLSLADSFDSACQAVRDDWGTKLAAMFTPGNSKFSGHLPVLWTDDKDLERLYYVSAVGAALCTRRNHPLSPIGTVYTTLVGDYWPTACFLWDMCVSDACWAMLDPAVLRGLLEAWIRMDIHKHLAVDSITGEGTGPWYAINDCALVHMAHTYLRFTGDFAWLDKEVAGRRLIDHLEHSALRWRELDKHGHGLADCGDGWNCGDGLTTWIHETAGFNAMWVAAQRQVADMREHRGEGPAAKNLRENANLLMKNLLGLYAQGGGYWHAGQPDGTHIPVRLLYDFVAIGEAVPNDLPDSVRREMIEYFLRELKTDHWVRGLSAWDDDSVRSFRPDWAWTGAYGSFPAMSVVSLRGLGCSEGWILDWVRRVAQATWQGPIAQTHMVEAVGGLVQGGVRKSTIGCWAVIAGASFPGMIVEQVFGAQATLREGLQWKGALPGLDPNARLDNLSYRGTAYRVTPRGIDAM